MKKQSFTYISARATLATLLVVSGISLLCLIPSLTRAAGGDLGSGSVGPAGSGISAAWDGLASGPGGGVNTEANCVEGVNCETYTLTVTGVPANWTNQKVQVLLTWTSTSNEYDLYIHKGTLGGSVVASAVAGPLLTTQVAFIDIAANGTGVYVVHIVYDTTPTAAADHYHGTATAVSTSLVPPPAAVVDTGNKVGYENFEAPGVLTPVTLTTGPTVEYLGRSAFEPSIGVNWNSAGTVNGVTNYQSDLETLFINFSDAPGNGGGATATWANRPAPTQTVIDSDPIGFTDRQTGRVFAAELSLTSPGCKISFTDTDGLPAGPAGWTATTGPVGSGIDHQTIGGGPYALPVPTPVPSPSGPVPQAVYPNAVYYCSQDLAAAFCLRSDDGGATWGPPVQTYLTECGGLHGHVKVGPDGTVYLPNKGCSGEEAAVVSENNGVTWNIRPVKNGTVQPASSLSDPATAIDANGRTYFAMAPGDSSAAIGYSNDHGRTWNNIVNVSSAFGLQNVRYPAAVAGDGGRAAIAFLGSTTAGDANSAGFNGVWHLYVSHTFDGGLTWAISDVTPTLPMQRGNIWTGGGANIGRNLADFFDITIDKQGRVQVGYANGCPGGDCSQSAPTAHGNAYAAVATIARQSSGKRLLGATDGTSAAATAPGIPTVTQRRVGTVVHLGWSEADAGTSPVTGYQIYRSTTSGAETLLANVSASTSRFDDYSATDSTKTYYYKVIATSGAGSSPNTSETAAPYVGSTCTGVVMHTNTSTHPEAAGGGAGQVPQLLINSVAVGEPFLSGAPNTNVLMFQMKVAGPLTVLPATSRWRMVWDSFSSPGQQYYVGMTTNGAGIPTFEYGTIATAVVGLVVGVPQETIVGAALPQSNYDASSGTITIYVAKSGVGNPPPGDLLGAVNGRTFGDNDGFERSTQLVDHTFAKSQTDGAFPTATYTVVGNGVCALQPVSAASRKTHGTNPTPFDIALLPLPANGVGIEDRVSGGNHQVVLTFASSPISFSSIVVTPGQGGTATLASSPAVSGNQVTVDLTNVSNAQVLTINLFGVSDGVNSGDISIPMGILAGDTTGDGAVNSADISQTKSRSGAVLGSANFRSDTNIDGNINSADISQVKSKSGTALPQ